jgi:hypothetical protein
MIGEACRTAAKPPMMRWRTWCRSRIAMSCSALRLTAAEQQPQQARDGQDDVTMRDRLEYSLHYRPQRTVRLGEPLRIDAQELLEVLFNQPEERGLPRPPAAGTPAHRSPRQPTARRERPARIKAS